MTAATPPPDEEPQPKESSPTDAAPPAPPPAAGPPAAPTSPAPTSPAPTSPAPTSPAPTSPAPEPAAGPPPPAPTSPTPISPAPAPPVSPPAPVRAVPTPPVPAPKPVKNAALKSRPRAPRPPGSRSGGVAVMIALLALLLAGAATVFGLYALDVARDAKSRAAAAASQNDAAANRPPASAAAPTTTPPAATPSPTPGFVADLRPTDLTAPPTVGCASIYVDVDSAQVGNFSGHDFYFSSCLGPLTARFDSVDAATAVPADPTPESCAQALRGVAPTPELSLTVVAGLTFCLFTSRQAADSAGIPQRLAIVEVRSVAADRTLTISLSTYRVPV